ncbi:MAG: 4-hydroxy-tetrahydrodipicolinate reductase [Pseudomonadota bacterium]
MSNPIKVVITGVSGRMGQMLVETLGKMPGAELFGVTERPGHDWIGKALQDVIPGAPKGVTVSDNPVTAFAGADAVIDFTAPQATLVHCDAAKAAGAALVVGTTGFSERELEDLETFSRDITMVRAGNMSLGVNLLTQLTRKVAQALDEDFDIEIVESHHRYKVDAPSGTALMLGEAAAEGRGVALSDVSDHARDGITGERTKGNIGFHAVRGGDIVGEHDVTFAADGERIVLRHIATDRAIFARGAIKAALWAQGKSFGHFTMLDVIGL